MYTINKTYDTPHTIDKRTLKLIGFKDKNITILISRKNRNCYCKNNTVYVNGITDRVFIYMKETENCDIHMVLTDLKKDKIFSEPIHSNKLRNIVTKKFKRDY